MNRLLRFIGIITLTCFGFYGIIWLYNNFKNIVEPVLMGLGLLSIIFILIRLYYGRKWWLGATKEFVIGSDLIKATENFLGELPRPGKESTSNFVGHLVYRFTRLGIIGVALALLPTMLLYNQNQLIKKQNERIDIQNNLIEAERRSSLVFLLSNILDKVDLEITEHHKNIENTDSTKYSLTKPLVNRIVALSRAFRPYRMMEGDTLSRELVSPERGQLFISLMENDFDSITQNTIVEKGDFSNALIDRIDIRGANLNKAQLTGARLDDAQLGMVQLNRAQLNSAKLIEAELSNAKLYKAQLRGAQLKGAVLLRTDLRLANLNGADLSNTAAIGTFFNKTNLKGVNFNKAHLTLADLSEADLSEAVFSEAVFNFVKGITKEQLLKCKTLFKCKGLPIELEAEIKQAKPCLFTKKGCD